MRVEAQNLKVESLLKKGGFSIPDYQREYDRGKEHVDQLFSDIKINGIGYFIGHMVLQWDEVNGKFNVIDGQQRITTITIILCAIRDVFSNIGEEDLAKGINDNYIFGKDVDNIQYPILSSIMPYPLFQKYVQSENDKKETVEPINSGEANIQTNYNYLIGLLSSGYEIDDLKDIRDKVLGLEVIFVDVKEGNPLSIFTTLNATGKNLTNMDLIKKELFSMYPRQPHINEPTDTRREILENISDNKKFLNYFWSSRYKKVSDEKIYNEFMDNIGDIDPKEFLEGMLSDSQYFRLIEDPDQSDRNTNEMKIYLSLHAITVIFGVKVCYSILLSLIRSYKKRMISKEFFMISLSAIERFHFVNNAIGSLRSSGLDTMYAKYAKKLYEAPNRSESHIVIRELVSKLMMRIPELRDQYEIMFAQKTYFTNEQDRNKRLVSYILKKIEYQKQNYNIVMNNMSLEHIIPQSSGTPEVYGKIGNIVLLDADLNGAVGSRAYESKKGLILDQSTIASTKEVFQNNNTFDQSTIENRSDKIKLIMFEEVWK